MITDDRPLARFLASVTSAEEGRVAVEHGADIIDCKDPRSGALGALPPQVVSAIRAAVPRGVPVSATIGDLPLVPGIVAAAVGAMAAAGADFVKIGFFAEGDVDATLEVLARRDEGAKLIAVLLADEQPDLGLVRRVAGAGFSGVMLDTGTKAGGTLLDVMPRDRIAAFVAEGRAANLMTGLAGSLRIEHIASLQRLGPDVLGFRGALCRDRDRMRPIEAERIIAVRRALDQRMRAERRAPAMSLEANADGGR